MATSRAPGSACKAWTAAPAFKNIAERYTVINPDLFADQNRLVTQQSNRIANTVEVPNFIGRDIGLATAISSEKKLELRCDNREGVVVWQYPPADRLIMEGDVILVAVESAIDKKSKTVANLKGLSIRQASAYLSHLGIKFKVEGFGEVISQSLIPGEFVESNAECRLACAGYKGET